MGSCSVPSPSGIILFANFPQGQRPLFCLHAFIVILLSGTSAFIPRRCSPGAASTEVLPRAPSNRTPLRLFSSVVATATFTIFSTDRIQKSAVRIQPKKLCLFFISNFFFLRSAHPQTTTTFVRHPPPYIPMHLRSPATMRFIYCSSFFI